MCRELRFGTLRNILTQLPGDCIGHMSRVVVNLAYCTAPNREKGQRLFRRMHECSATRHVKSSLTSPHRPSGGIIGQRTG